MHFTEILGIITIVLVFGLGFCLMYFARVIVDYFYLGLPFGFPEITAKIINFIFHRNNSTVSKKIGGEDVYAWVIRIFGGLWILFGFIMIFSILRDK
jgi:hypothetical protein